MGTVVKFPALPIATRPAGAPGRDAREGMGEVVILPVIRIERAVDTSDGRGPEEGATPGRRRRRRARS